MSLSKSETDIILNKANIALARSQRLVASWLPVQLPDAADQRNAKTEAELQREEDDIFTAVPETLGLGAALPTKAADGSWNRTELDSNDQLRRQLLGRNYKKVMAEKARQKNAKSAVNSLTTMTNSAPKERGLQRSEETTGGKEDDEEDEEDGRTASIGRKNFSKKRKVAAQHERARMDEVNDGPIENSKGGGDNLAGGRKATGQLGPRSKGRKKAISFLDEILAERSKKRRKQ
ncbi:hypothetical protein BJX64DRAFT_290197 [Aspergillus heterothallicus]